MTEKNPTAENLQPEPIENLESQVENTADSDEAVKAVLNDAPAKIADESENSDAQESSSETGDAQPEEITEEISETSENMPQDEPVEEIPEQAPALEVVSEAPVADIPEEEPPAEPVVAVPETGIPAEEPVKEPAPEPVIEKPDAAPVKAEQVEESEHDTDHVSGSDADIMHEISELESDETHEEEDEDFVEEEEIVEKYDTYTREKLVEVLEDTVKEENVLKIKTRIALIKVAFLKLSRDYRQQKLDEHLKTGGSRENYTPEPDPLMEKFNQVFEVYKKNKAKFNEHQEVLKLRNLDAKKAILEELKELINSDETLKKTYDRFKELQASWKEIGLVPATEINNLWQNYHFLVEKFFDKVKISKELRDLDLRKNLEKKMELCEKAEELLIEPSVVKSFQQLQKYHEEWKEIGPVPQDKRDEIWERFKTATDKINERRREHYSSLTKDQESNLAAKIILCEKAEQIISMETDSLKDWQDRTREINDFFREWKTIGPAPKKDNDEIWDRFKSYINSFFSAKKDYFNKLKQEQTNNYNLKLDIVKQAELLKDSTDWRSTTQELINLQKEWKNIGPVPRRHSDRIWKRFRAACDEFFQNKSKHFSSVVESEKDNLDKKLDLIKRVEEWTAGSNKSQNLDALKNFQREWTEIGHVPIKEKNRVHDAFRQAINKHLDELNISGFEMRSQEHRSRQDYDSDGDGKGARRDMSSLSVKATKLREEIMLWENNIGFLAHSKNAEILRKEFELKIQKAKEELAEYEAKLKSMHESR